MGNDIIKEAQSLLDLDPVAAIELEDKLSPVYKWGDGLHPIQILIDLRRHFGYEWPEWDQSVLLKKVEQEFGTINDVTINKILSIQVALLRDSTWIDMDVFEKTGVSFANMIPIWTMRQQLDLDDMAFTCGVLDRIEDMDAEENPNRMYGDEVRGYISAVLMDNGVIVTPPNCPLPPTNDLNRHFVPKEAQEIGQIAVERWNQGIMSAGDIDDPVDVLLAKFFIIETMYNEGEKYVTPRGSTTV